MTSSGGTCVMKINHSFIQIKKQKNIWLLLNQDNHKLTMACYTNHSLTIVFVVKLVI